MTADARRAWEIVLDAIEGDLVAGLLKPGDHLAPERQLATEHAVGRSSVREAIRVLEILGLVQTQTGSGPNSGAVLIARPTGGMSALIRLHVASQGFRVADIVRTRLVLEAAVVGELAERARRALAPSIDLLDTMDDATLTATEFLALDAQFHLSLAKATGNEVITAMMAGLRSSIESYVTAGLPTSEAWQVTSERLRLEHRGILGAIAAREPERARALVTGHIAGYYALTRLIGTTDGTTDKEAAHG